MQNTTIDKNTKVTYFNPQSPAIKTILARVNSNWKLSLFYLHKIPSLFFWGIKVKKVTPQKAAVALPFSWRTQNPFRSTYFAAQAGAAELPAGMLASIAIEGQVPISMLPVKVEAEFVKKASSTVIFTCEDGNKIMACVQRALDTGEGQQVEVMSSGIQENGDVVSRVKFTWSFKVKSTT